MSFNIYEDNRAGLMPQIQALIAPPASDKSSDKKSTEHVYFKRPGRGHNHDLCDCCGEGGDLICCDKCPSSFHLQCHVPPLEVSHIPSGEWLCHKCKYLSVKNKDKGTVSTNSQNYMDLLVDAAKLVNPKLFELPYELMEVYNFPGSDKDILPYIRPHHLRRPCSLSIAPNLRSTTSASSSLPHTPSQSTTSGSSMTSQPLSGRCYECRKSCQKSLLLKCDYCSLYWHLDCLRPPLAAPPVVRWMCPNHVEHTLDAKLLTSASATERSRIWNAFKAPVDQDAIKMAFFRKIHRKNPPFRVKTRRSQRKKACVIPEMVKNHYRQPVALLPSLRDALREENVRLRLNNLESCFQDYCDISNDIDEIKNVIDPIKSPNVDKTMELTHQNDKISKNNDDINTDILKIAESDKFIKETDEEESNFGETIINSDLLQNIRSCNTVWKLDRESEDFLTEVLLENDRRQLKLQEEQRRNNQERQEMIIKTDCDVKNEDKGEIMQGQLDNDVLEANYIQLRQLDIRLLRALALQRIQQLLSSTSTPTINPSPIMPLPSQLLTAEDIERISKAFNGGVYNDVSQVPLPHHYPNNMTPEQQRQQERQERDKQERLQLMQQHQGNGRITMAAPGVGANSGSCVRARAMLCPVISKYFYNVRTQDVDAVDVRHDASFMGYRPTVSARFPEATAMRYRCITIGRGVANDLQLDRYGHCNYISAKHAVIFYDEYTKHYELLNYSLYGTSVNNVRYSNDNTVAGLSTANCCGSQLQSDDSNSTNSNASSSDSSNNNQTMLNNGGIAAGNNCTSSNSTLMEKQIVRDIIDKRRKIILNGGGKKIMANDCKMATMDMADRMECSCAGNPAVNNNIADISATGPTTTVTYNKIASANSSSDNRDILGGLDAGLGTFSGSGWEGSALLSHGALLRFGCIAFVFSIVDCATL